MAEKEKELGKVLSVEEAYKDLPEGLREFEKKFCEHEIPTGYNIFEFVRTHKDTSIAASFCRIRRIFNRADSIMIGISGGKDSTLSLEMASLEVQYRKELSKAVKEGTVKGYPWANDIKRGSKEYGNYEDLEFVKENNIPRIICNSMDAEWIYSDPQRHIRVDISQKLGKGCFIYNGKLVLGMDILPENLQDKDNNILTFFDLWETMKSKAELREATASEKGAIHSGGSDLVKDFEDETLQRYARLKDEQVAGKVLATDKLVCVYEGNNSVQMFYKCLRLGWQSGVTFGDSRLISWDANKKDMWIRNMPTRYEEGVDICETGELEGINYVPVCQIDKALAELHKDDIEEINGVPCIPNFGYGKKPLSGFAGIPDEDWNCWSFDCENEDMEQETFGEWILRNSVAGSKIYNLVSLRAAESFDRYTILKQSDYFTGNYANQESNKNGVSIHICSPVMDLTTSDVWRLFSATDWGVSGIYEKMYEAGIGIDLQRVGSLLNFCATKNIAQVKTLEPDMYARINARFQNVEFMSQFSKAGYYKIGKPADSTWNGRSHIKAGVSDEDNKKLADRYENILKKYAEELKALGTVGYTRGKDDSPERNTFKFEEVKKQGSALKQPTPLKDLIEEHVRRIENNEAGIIAEEDLNEITELNRVHVTWRDYCLYMLNTTSEPLRSSWREKMITSILSWKYGEGSSEPSTVEALEILSDIDPKIVKEVTDDEWSKSDFHVGGTLPISGKVCFSISHYPQESLEKECADVLKYLIDNKMFDELKKSKTFMKFADRCVKTKEMVSPSVMLSNMFGNKSGSQKNMKEEVFYTQEQIDKVKEFDEEWVYRVRRGIDVWFRESIHSTSSWKRFCINILKNDVTCKYLGFGQTLAERAARAKATEAFSQKQEEKAKAKAEAENLAKKIQAENEANAKLDMQINK